MPYDPTVPSVTLADRLLSVLLLLVALGATGLIGAKLRYYGIDSETRRKAKQAVERQLVKRSSGTVRIPKGDADQLDEYRPAIRRAFEHTGAADDVDTVRGALRDGRARLREARRPVVEALPPVVRRLGAVALWVLVFGALASSTESIVSALSSEGGLSLPPVEVLLSLAVSEPPKAAGRAHELVAGLPAVGTAGSLAFAYAVLGYEALYNGYAVVVAVLATSAGVLWWYDAPPLRTDVDGDALPGGRDVAKGAAAAGLVVVAIVELAIGAGRLAGDGDTGVLYGAVVLVFLALVLATAAGLALRSGVRTLRLAVRRARHTGETAPAVARIVGLGTLAVTAPLVPVWTLVGASRLPEVVEAWLAARTAVQVLTVAVAVWALVVVAYVARDELRRALSSAGEQLRRRSFRWRAVGAGVPLVLVATAWVGLGAFRPAAPVTNALLAGMVGVLGRLGWLGYVRLRTALGAAPRPPEDAATVVVHAYEFDLPSGPQYYARVNTTPVADPNREAAVDAVLERAEAAFRDEIPGESLAQRHATYLREDGVEDPEVTRKRLREDVEAALRGKANDEAVDDVEADLRAEYPEEVVEEVLDRAGQHGLGGVRTRTGRVLGVRGARGD